MSNKGTKYVSEYKAQRKRIKGIATKLQKQGYEIDFELAPKPAKITRKEIEKLKAIKPITLRKQAYKIDYGTGEFKTAQDLFKEARKESAKQGAKTRRKNRESEMQFWSGTEPTTHVKVDGIDGEKISTQNVPKAGEIAYKNMYEHFIMRLAQPITRQADFRKANLRYMSETRRINLLSLANQQVAQYGEETVGLRLLNAINTSDVEEKHGGGLDGLISAVLGDSKEEVINTAYIILANALTGKNISVEENKNISEEAESWEDYESPF